MWTTSKFLGPNNQCLPSCLTPNVFINGRLEGFTQISGLKNMGMHLESLLSAVFCSLIFLLSCAWHLTTSLHRSWSSIKQSGREDAVAISRKLQKMGWVPELILSRVGHVLVCRCFWKKSYNHNTEYCSQWMLVLCYLILPTQCCNCTNC